jgi:preprotein translocase subunit SecE
MMAEKDKNEKRMEKSGKKPNAMQKLASGMAKLGKRLKSWFINLKAEIKRVVWPDRKRLIQNTATVLAICVLAGLLLFIIDWGLGRILEGIGFYKPSSVTTATTTAVETISTETTPATTGGTTSSGTTQASAGTTAAGTTQATTGTTTTGSIAPTTTGTAAK